MSLSNCKDCGKVFQKTITDSCPACVKKKNDNIAKIDSYAFKNRDFTLEELSKKTDISVDDIRKLLAEGKINSIKSLKTKCEMCGKETLVSTTTFLCRDCVSDIKSVQTTKDDKTIIKQHGKTSGMRSRKDD